jgi:hypothetical protein
MHSLFGGKQDFSKKIGEIGGIYVAWVCYFDELYDKSPDAISYIKNHIDNELFTKAMNDGFVNENIFLKNIQNNLKTIPFFLLWQSYIKECFKLYKLSMRTNVWKEFISTISEQYFQHFFYNSTKRF